MEKREKVVKIQARIRGILDRNKVYGMKEAQELLRQKKAKKVREEKLFRLKKWYLAIRIQMCAKKFLEKLQYKKSLESERMVQKIKIIQKNFRGYRQRQKYKDLKSSIVQMQSLFKTKLAKLHLKKLKEKKLLEKVKKTIEQARKLSSERKAEECARLWRHKAAMGNLNKRIEQIERERDDLNVRNFANCCGGYEFLDCIFNLWLIFVVDF